MFHNNRAKIQGRTARNGDPVAAVRVIMKPFAGQTEQSAYSRALPIIREMQGRVASLQDLVQ